MGNIPIDALVSHSEVLRHTQQSKDIKYYCLAIDEMEIYLPRNGKAIGTTEWTRTTDPHHVKVVL